MIAESFYCSNCGQYSHKSRFCPEPVMSIGLICINYNCLFEQKIENINIREILETSYIDAEHINKINFFQDTIEFLMIQRKHSLGFIEFMRGRYEIEDIDGIIHLFKQMIPEEIEKLRSMEYEELWLDFWCNIRELDDEYYKTKIKYDSIKEGGLNMMNLDFYLDNVEQTWTFSEWGFPKGRRNKHELDYDCAIREFQEEIGLNEDQLIIFDKEHYIDENFIGTNGIRYRHRYFIGMLKREITAEDITTQIGEIGNMSMLKYQRSMDLIRPHHSDRKNIITKIYLYLLNTLCSYYNIPDEYFQNSLTDIAGK